MTLSRSRDLELVASGQGSAFRLLEKWEAEETKQIHDYLSGKELLEQLLWKSTKGIEGHLYGSIAKELTRLILIWKKEHHEILPASVCIWLNYEAKLLDPEWRSPLRALPDNEGQTASYHWWPDQEKYGYGPVDYWYGSFLSNEKLHPQSLAQDMGVPLPPSTHTYLRELAKACGGSSLAGIVMFRISASAEHGIVGRSSESFRYVGLRGDYASTIRNQLFCPLIWPARVVDAPRLAEGTSLWASWYASFLGELFNSHQDAWMQRDWQPLLKEMKSLRGRKEPCREALGFNPSSMATFRIHVPGTDVDLGSLMLFSDVVPSPGLLEVMRSVAWPIFARLRQIEERIIGEKQIVRHGMRSALSAIMARNMSHNLGSHALDDVIGRLESSGNGGHEKYEKAELIRFLRYLRARMDFLAEITTTWRGPFD